MAQLEVQNNTFEEEIQPWVNALLFFTGFPFVSIGASITFYIFLIIVFKTNRNFGYIFKIEKSVILLYIFFGLSLISSIFLAPIGYREMSVFSAFKINIQLLYWISALAYFKHWYPLVNLEKSIKYAVLGLIVMLVGYFFLGIGSQNGVSFNVVCFSGLWFLYFKDRNKVFLLVSCVLLCYVMILNESRSGAILVFLQMSFFVLPGVIGKRWKLVLVSLLLIVSIFRFSGILGGDFDQFKSNIGNAVTPYNAEIGQLFLDTESVLERDKSWLTRKMMVQKGLILMKEYPYFGVGIGQFDDMWVNIPRVSIWANSSMTEYNRRSSHNSLVQILAEHGIIGGFFYFSFMLNVVFLVIRDVLRNDRIEQYTYLGVSAIVALVYFYTISSHLGLVHYLITGFFLGGNVNRSMNIRQNLSQ